MQKLALLALFVVGLAQPQRAQNFSKEALLADPNIIWVAESLDFIILDVENPVLLEDEDYLKQAGWQLSDWQLVDWYYQRGMKCVQLKTQMEAKNGFAQAADGSLMSALMHPRQPIIAYRDKECNLPLANPSQYLLLADTLITFDPVTVSTDTAVIPYELNLEKVKSFQLYQLLYFDQRNNCFGSLPLAIAPMQMLYDDQDRFLGEHKPIFWLKINHLSQAAELNNINIRWARQTQRHLEVSKLKVLKSTQNIYDCFGLHLSQIRSNYLTEKIYPANSEGNYLSAEEVKNLGIQTDTFFRYDPINERFTDIISKQKEVPAKSLHALSWVQQWYWDSSSNSLSLYNVLCAPMVNTYDEDGNNLRRELLFYKASK